MCYCIGMKTMIVNESGEEIGKLDGRHVYNMSGTLRGTVSMIEYCGYSRVHFCGAFELGGGNWTTQGKLVSQGNGTMLLTAAY